MSSLDFTIVLPVKDERDLLERSLPTCYAVRPSEIVVCFDKPAPTECVRVVKELSAKFSSVQTNIAEVERSAEWRFHQAHVRREGFLKARYDRILTVDVDLLINANVLRAVRLVGRDNIGLASCSKVYPIRGPIGFWRAAAYHLARRVHFAPFSGLYAVWRPFWLDTEGDGIKQLEDPKTRPTLGQAAVGEDTYLVDRMRAKHHVIYLREVGAYCMTERNEDLPRIQFEMGRYFADRGERPLRVLVRSLMYARTHQMRGYLYQRRLQKSVPG